MILISLSYHTVRKCKKYVTLNDEIFRCLKGFFEASELRQGTPSKLSHTKGKNNTCADISRSGFGSLRIGYIIFGYDMDKS